MSSIELIAELRDTASKGVSVWGDLQKEAADAIEALEATRESLETENAQLTELLRVREAQLAAKQAQPVCGYDDKTGNCTRVNCCKQAQPEQPSKYGSPELQALILDKLQQAQPERAPLTDAEIEQEFCNIAGLETGINPAAADTKRALVWFKKGYVHGIKQGGQHD